MASRSPKSKRGTELTVEDRADPLSAGPLGLHLGRIISAVGCVFSRKQAVMGNGTTALLAALDSQIMRHQSSISFVTAALAILGVGAMALGLARISPLLKVLSPF